MQYTIEDLLRVSTFLPNLVEAVIAPEERSWAKFDPELGYVPSNIELPDGINGTVNKYTFEPAGYRMMAQFRECLCRINSYGNSFTLCQQVSDGETWQEHIATFIREPIRNFGVGGYGVFQAVRRAIRMECTTLGAKYVILNIFDDDHIRSLDACRWIRTAWRCRENPIASADHFHGLPWCHVRYHVQQAEFVECPGKCRTVDDLRSLCDPDRFRATFADDQIVRLFSLQSGINTYVDDLEELANVWGLTVNLRDQESKASDARRLYLIYGQRVSQFVIEHFRQFLQDRGKKLILILSFGERRLGEYLVRRERFDALFIDYLESMAIPFVDMREKHLADFHYLGVPVTEYLSRYFIQPAGAAVFEHYSPAGNRFFASALKDELADYLDG